MELVPRQNGAQQVVAAVCDSLASQRSPIPRHHLATLGRHARTLLEDGFDFQLVIAAAEIALRRGQPQFLCFIAHDLQMVQDGKHLSRRAYSKALEDEMEVGNGRARRPRRGPDG